MEEATGVMQNITTGKAKLLSGAGRALRRTLALAALSLAAATPLAAQNLFAPAIEVNDGVVTNYEIAQRIAFLELLNTPGDVQERAREALVGERLQTAEADRLGVTVPPEALEAAMAEFAGRANLSTQEFIAALGQAGVEAETFRDFVRAGILWRNTVQQRYAGRVRITEAEVDRALAATQPGGGVRVLLSEIILPATSPELRAQSQQIAPQLAEIRSFDAFSAAAREYSASESRDNGGQLDWLDLSTLPPQIRAQVLPLAPGQVAGPFPLENAIALFQMRSIAETSAGPTPAAEIDYAAFFIPGGRSEAALAEAARIRAEIDVCDDLYGIAKGLPEEQLVRESVPAGQVPAAYARELSSLDPGEASTALVTSDGQSLVFLMMCGRTTAAAQDISREEIRNQLLNQRLASYAAAYLAELEASAYINELN